MLRRNLASEFVAGAYVFPGGSVDPADRGDAADELCRGMSDDEASEILGIELGRPGLLGRRAARVLRGGRRAPGPAPRRRPGDRPARHLRPGRAGQVRGAPAGDQRGPDRPARRVPGRGPGPGGRRRALREPLGDPGAGPQAVRHALLRDRRPAGTDRPARRRRDHRHDLGAPPGRPRPVRRRRDRAAAAHHRQPPEAGAPHLHGAGHGLGPGGHRRPDDPPHRPDRGRAAAGAAPG